MALMFKWHSDSLDHIVETAYPVTEKEKAVFAEAILSVVRDGWDVTVYVDDSDWDDDIYMDDSDAEDYVYDTAD